MSEPEHDYHPPSDDSPDRLVHDAMKVRMTEMARLLSGILPSGVGFTLFLFQYGPGGWLTYISSADRADTHAMLAEWVARPAVVSKMRDPEHAPPEAKSERLAAIICDAFAPTFAAASNWKTPRRYHELPERTKDIFREVAAAVLSHWEG